MKVYSIENEDWMQAEQPAMHCGARRAYRCEWCGSRKRWHGRQRPEGEWLCPTCDADKFPLPTDIASTASLSAVDRAAIRWNYPVDSHEASLARPDEAANSGAACPELGWGETTASRRRESADTNRITLAGLAWRMALLTAGCLPVAYLLVLAVSRW